MLFHPNTMSLAWLISPSCPGARLGLAGFSERSCSANASDGVPRRI
jgi:hypothetical protein